MKRITIVVLSLLVFLNGCNVSSDSNEVIQIEDSLTELVVSYPDGLVETITDDYFLNAFKKGVNTNLVEIEELDDRFQIIFTFNIEGEEWSYYYFKEGHPGRGELAINGKYYEFTNSSYLDLYYMFSSIANAHTLADGTNNQKYNPRNKVSTINDLFSNILKVHGDFIVDNSDVAGAGGFSNGTNMIYNFILDEYQFTFFNNEAMNSSLIKYNWIDRIAKLDSCEYNRNNDTYTDCSEYQQAWIKESLDLFLISCGNYMDESDFLAQEKDFVFVDSRNNENSYIPIELADSNDFHIEDDLTELVVTYSDGLTETITDSTLLGYFKEGINNNLVEADRFYGDTPLLFTIQFNDNEWLYYSYGGVDARLGQLLINGHYYSSYNPSIVNFGYVLTVINQIHALEDRTDDWHYAKENKVSTINDLFDSLAVEKDSHIIDNNHVRRIGLEVANGTKAIYDFEEKEYRFSFLNKNTIQENVITYNWIDRISKLDSCEYNRNTDTFTNCSEYQQAWIQESFDAFLVSYGNYMDESDFLAQESDYVVKKVIS